MAKRKIIQKNTLIATQLRDVLDHYNQFVRSLHIKESHSLNTRLITRQLIKKLIIVGIGAFFTTAAFYFLMDPLRIYNPGLNGLLKKITQCLVGTESVGTLNFYLVYYGINLVLNSMIVYSLWKRHQANLEIIDTQWWPLTLPLYLVVSLVAAAAHVQGYSLIFQVQAAPSGFET
ncbi:21277_t:CDS:2, partial [Cetraspora pellucida]